jgi:GAF domain-containing protein
MRRGAKPAKSRVEAKPPIVHKSRKSKGVRVHDLEKRLAEALKREAGSLKRESEALEQQAATSEVLRAVSRVQTDAQPVFDIIAASAQRLCGAAYGQVQIYDGELIHLAALQSDSPEGTEAIRRIYPLRVGDGSAGGRAIGTRAVAQIPDLLDERVYAFTRVWEASGLRSLLAVPMLRESEPIGAIGVGRIEPGPFSDNQIELLKTFADQAVIAIENVRLFRELESRNRELTQALDQQTATSEILRVIGSSPTDAQPVFETIARSGLSVCSALGCVVFVVDGDMLRVAATDGVRPERVERFRRDYPILLSAEIDTAQTVRGRRIVHLADIAHNPNATARDVEYARLAGYRTRLMIPMVRGDRALGLIAVTREDPAPFPGQLVELLRTFADQAVIAIENVRLFTELQKKNHALTEAHAHVTEALEQQTATSEILRVIAASPTDLQAVLDALVESAARLCEADYGFLARYDGTSMAIVAHSGATDEEIKAVLRVYPMAPTPDSLGGRTILERAVVHIPDVRSDPTYGPRVIQDARWRTGLGVPLLREGTAIGLVGMWRRDVRPFTGKQISLLQTFADQAVIAIENVRLFKELQTRNLELTEALDRQTATTEVLRVISQSQTEVQPVFDAIVQNAVRLCHARYGIVFNFDGDLVHLVAHHNFSETWLEEIRKQYPMRPTRAHISGRAILSASVVQIPDVALDPEYGSPLAARVGFRSLLAVPILHDGAPVGSIVIYRPEPGPFPDKHISLLQTFADQAVIAIENVRLFTELQEKNLALTAAHAQVTEALERQTATSEVLKVISRSTFDLQPILDTLIENAARLCDARRGVILRRDGDSYHGVAFYGASPDLVEFIRRHPVTPGRHTITARVALERRTMHVADIQADPEYRYAVRDVDPIRTELGVPMFRGDDLLGVIILYKLEVQPFTDKQIELVETFADQAVIAVENVRLFTELQEKNRALTEAHAQVIETLDRQTATSEILRVISRSHTDIQPVFDTIAESAARLCEAQYCFVYRFEGQLLYFVAHHGLTAEVLEINRGAYPAAPSRRSVAARAVLERSVVQIPDVNADPDYALGAMAAAGGYRSAAAVPILRDGLAIGSIAITRAQTGLLPERQIELLKTFADQAVIAIENVRLFKELEARTHDLTRSVGELRALGEVGQAISSTLDLRTVLSTIVTRATQLSGTDAGVIYEYDEQREVFLPRATEHLESDIVETMLATPVRKGEGATGRLAEVHAPNQVADILVAPAESRVRSALVRAGYRALLAVPLVREDHLLGGLTVVRKVPGEFAAEIIELLRTFATQSALAIQNARLFREIADKSRQLEVASQHKSEFLANMSHELRTPLNAVIGFSEVLGERMFGELNEKQDEYVRDIYVSGAHLLSLINDILDLSKVEAGRMELELADFHLPQAIDNALVLVRERALRRDITLEQSIDPRLGEIQGDERKIKQVLLNLLSNAIKFTPEGGRVGVQAEPVDEHVEVAVSDTGVGIAPEDQEAVFEEFRQVGTAEKKAEGTGLGLALARKFIELHGGRIWVKSQVGVGSTFTFTLPVPRGE